MGMGTFGAEAQAEAGVEADVDYPERSPGTRPLVVSHLQLPGPEIGGGISVHKIFVASDPQPE